MRSKSLLIGRGTLLYISGAISPTIQHPNFQENLDKMREVGERWFHRGYSVFIPGSNNSGWHGVTHEEYLETDLCILYRCDGIVMMKGYMWSIGAMQEIERAQQLGKVVFFDEYFTKYNGKE